MDATVLWGACMWQRGGKDRDAHRSKKACAALLSHPCTPLSPTGYTDDEIEQLRCHLHDNPSHPHHKLHMHWKQPVVGDAQLGSVVSVLALLSKGRAGMDDSRQLQYTIARLGLTWDLTLKDLLC